MVMGSAATGLRFCVEYFMNNPHGIRASTVLGGGAASALILSAFVWVYIRTATAIRYRRVTILGLILVAIGSSDVVVRLLFALG
jgi:hypothetical protein